MTSSSIRWSFAGGHVGCTMNTSRPRTFSISSTVTSPSLNRPTLRAARAASSGDARCPARAAGLALPANTAIVATVHRDSRFTLTVWRRADRLAGVEGFEPPNGGIKTRCLTTWRRPSVIVSERLRSAPPRAAPARAAATDSDPRTTYPRQRTGSRASVSRARRARPASPRTRTTPVPVSRAGATRPSQSSASATAG